ncbi:hypothetical protein BKA67DRAFT_654438 [Truncatella angustata]|uniref:Uncharacterized protein n=1 Tax=Truncatella angustata TaxID=152316 RepID=A0A9P8UZM7_9PEZI|nr:uncharacterized protein BKA67DRAFT_654438 [Truncatella angustata]KAH6661318.1 hypothetical protein BKA67DRAFT_654438 [Truncatella angustata]
MSFAGPNAIRDGVRPSNVLSKEDDGLVQYEVFDCGHAYIPQEGMPQVFIGNKYTGCRAEYFPRRGRQPAKFLFYHGYDPSVTAACGCLTKSQPKTITCDLPRALAEHGVGLVSQKRLETKMASIVVMKLFLGLYVPESLQGPFFEEENERQAKQVEQTERPTCDIALNPESGAEEEVARAQGDGE